MEEILYIYIYIALYVGILSPFIIEKPMKAKSFPNGKIFVIIKKQLK